MASLALPPLLAGIGLLTLLVVRQAAQFLETARLRRAAEAVRAEERAQREFNRRKDELLGVVAHELRTPLTSLEMFFALAARRLGTVPPPPPREAGVGAAGRALTRAPDAERLQTALAYSEASVRRLERLADDLADDARVVAGRLRLLRARFGYGIDMTKCRVSRTYPGDIPDAEREYTQHSLSPLAARAWAAEATLGCAGVLGRGSTFWFSQPVRPPSPLPARQ